MAMARLLMSLGSNLGPADKSQRNGAESVDSGSVRAEAKRREGDVRFTGNSRQSTNIAPVLSLTVQADSSFVIFAFGAAFNANSPLGENFL
jgi:hypothetical protein